MAESCYVNDNHGLSGTNLNTDTDAQLIRDEPLHGEPQRNGHSAKLCAVFEGPRFASEPAPTFTWIPQGVDYPVCQEEGMFSA